MSAHAAFWQGKRVLVTGHTGFKGAWLALWLAELGADVHGFSQDVPGDPSLFAAARAGELLADVRGDVRDADAVAAAVADTRPQVVFHLAAQSLVRRGLREPRLTFETNVLGTVNVLDALRGAPDVRAVVNVTSDKCYENRELGRPFREDDPLGGTDPYSCSKACAEIVARSYAGLYGAGGPRLASARAGNVIGGGDWGEDRLVPDLVRGALDGTPVAIRNPASVRPWQHVLSPLSGYLLLAERLWEGPEAVGGWNFGPDEQDALTVGEVAGRVRDLWPGALSVVTDGGPHPPEAVTLRLDAAKSRERLGWRPGWDVGRALEATVAWHAAVRDGADPREVTLGQVREFAGAAVA